MKRIHNVAFIGLALNILAFLFICYNLHFNSGAYELYADRSTNHFLSLLVIPMAVCLVVQILCVCFLPKNIKLCLVLAMFASIIFLPIGLVFIIGFQMTSNDINFNRLKSISVFDKSKLTPYVNFNVSQFYIIGTIMIIAGPIFLSMGAVIGALLIALGILMFINGKRNGTRPILSLDASNLIITPNIYSQTYTVPVEDVLLTKITKTMLYFTIQGKNIKIPLNLLKDKKDVVQILKCLPQKAPV